MEFKTRDLTLVAVFAAIYVVLVAVLAPISFSALQLRMAGVIRPGIAKKRILVIGYALGVLIGNMFSPFTGFHELVFMPFMSLVAGVAGYYAARPFKGNYFVAGAAIAVIIPLSVSWMLNQLFGLPILATLPGLFLSEQIVNALGAVVFQMVDTRYRWHEE